MDIMNSPEPATSTPVALPSLSAASSDRSRDTTLDRDEQALSEPEPPPAAPRRGSIDMDGNVPEYIIFNDAAY